MCQSCVEIDKQVEHYRELLRSTRDQKEIERISRMIAKLYGDSGGRIEPAPLIILKGLARSSPSRDSSRRGGNRGWTSCAEEAATVSSRSRDPSGDRGIIYY